MRQFCQHLAFAVSGLVFAACSQVNAWGDEPTGHSTIRTVSVAGVPTAPASLGNVVRFPETTGNKSQSARIGATSAGASTVNFVESHNPQPARAKNWVQQAQFTASAATKSEQPAATSTAPVERSSWVFTDPASTEHDAYGAPASTRAVVAAAAAASAPPLKSPRPAAAVQAAPGWHPYDANLPAQSRQLLEYFGSNSARATLSQMPRRTPIQPSASPTPRQRAKPFQGVQTDPTVSPYLNLHRDEADAENVPNYHAFVRPQLEQLDANRRQQLEILRLQRQMQATSSTVAMPQYSAAPGNGPRQAARYMDTAQFFGTGPR